jgi:hypothetical protein
MSNRCGPYLHLNGPVNFQRWEKGAQGLYNQFSAPGDEGLELESLEVEDATQWRSRLATQSGIGRSPWNGVDVRSEGIEVVSPPEEQRFRAQEGLVLGRRDLDTGSSFPDTRKSVRLKVCLTYAVSLLIQCGQTR